MVSGLRKMPAKNDVLKNSKNMLAYILKRIVDER